MPKLVILLVEWYWSVVAGDGAIGVDVSDFIWLDWAFLFEIKFEFLTTVNVLKISLPTICPLIGKYINLLLNNCKNVICGLIKVTIAVIA